MGILGYPNMDDNNRDGIFGDYSDVYSNYPEENSGAQVVNEDKQVGDNLQAEIEQPGQDSAIPPIAPQAERQANGRLMFYIVVFIIVAIHHHVAWVCLSVGHSIFCFLLRRKKKKFIHSYFQKFF